MNTLIIDHGSYFLKAGMNSQNTPQINIESIVGRQKNSNDYIIQNLNEDIKPNLILCSPIQNSEIVDFDKAKELWTHIYGELQQNPRENRVIFSEKVNNNKKQKQKVMEIFFEDFQVSSFTMQKQGVMGLLGLGQETGLVVDSGQGNTQIVPVFQGFLIKESANSINLAGNSVDNYFKLLMRRSGYSFNSRSELDFLRKIKEKKCFLNPQLVNDSNLLKDPCVLPDGSIIEITNEKTMAPEILFYPQKLGLDTPSLHHFIIQQLQLCDQSLRKQFYENIVLIGGNTQIQGFCQRLLNELRQNTPKEVGLKIIAKVNRNIQCWIGGYVMSQNTSFDNQFITVQQYLEEGERLFYQ